MNNTTQIIEMIDLFYALKRMHERLKKQENGLIWSDANGDRKVTYLKKG